MSKFSEKVQQDVKSIEQKYLKLGAEEVLSHAYELTFISEFGIVCETIDEMLDDTMADDEEREFYENLGRYEGNVAEALFEDWLGYNHPEYYNFCTYEGMQEIIQDFIKRTIHKGGQ